jgi:Zn-dependent protease with chaperone function
MHSTSAPSEGRLFDGASARARSVAVSRTAEALALAGPDYADEVPLGLLRQDQARDRLTLHRTDYPDWRLVLPAAAANDWADVAKLHGMSRRQWGGLGGSIAGVAAFIALFALFGNRILMLAAPLVPQSVTQPIGRNYAEMIAGGDKACVSPAGEAALAKLVARVRPRTGFVEPVQVRVADIPDTNAFTFPGGQVIILAGLLHDAGGPDEVAGVLAHEFGHVQKRHANQALIRHFGLDVFLQGLGGNLGSVAATGLFLTNSRDAEREADAEAIAMLHDAGVSTLGTARFFARMEGKAGGKAGSLATLAATHPSDASREGNFKKAAVGRRTTPALSDGDWRALKAICRDAGEVERVGE